MSIHHTSFYPPKQIRDKQPFEHSHLFTHCTSAAFWWMNVLVILHAPFSHQHSVGIDGSHLQETIQFVTSPCHFFFFYLVVLPPPSSSSFPHPCFVIYGTFTVQVVSSLQLRPDQCVVKSKLAAFNLTPIMRLNYYALLLAVRKSPVLLRPPSTTRSKVRVS